MILQAPAGLQNTCQSKRLNSSDKIKSYIVTMRGIQTFRLHGVEIRAVLLLYSATQGTWIWIKCSGTEALCAVPSHL